MGKEGLGASVCDASALIAIERGDRFARQLVRQAADSGTPVVVPAPVLAQVWRDGARQARLAQFLAVNGTVIEALDELGAKAIGVLLGRAGSSDVVDASVVVSARRHAAIILTSDAADLRRIDPHLAVEEL